MTTSYTIPSVAGVEADLAANAAADRNRANHTGSQSADTITDGTTQKAYTGTERVKLAGIASGATVNRPDTAVDTLLAAKADLVGGVIPTGQIPALALTNAVPVASQAAMLALTAAQVQPGDIAIRADGAGTFILTAADPTQLASWTRLNAPTDAVTTVNGQAGTVVLSAADVGADAAGAAAAAQAAAVQRANHTGTQPASTVTGLATVATSGAYGDLSGRPAIPATAADVGADPAGAAAAVTKASLGLGNVDNTADASKPISGPQAAGLYPSTEPGAVITSPDGVSQSGVWTPRALPLTAPSKVISRFPSGVASGWTGGTGDDTTTTLFSDRTYKTVTNGTGASIYIGPPAFTAQDWSTSIIRIYLRCLNPAVFATLAVNVTMGAGNVASAGINHNMLTGEWSVITLNRSQFGVSAGVINWAGVTQVQVRMQDNKSSSGATTIWVGGIELIPDRAAIYPNGVFVMECDDGYAGQKTLLAPVVGSRGIPVTMNVISDRFTGGTPASGMTAADLRTFQDKWGWQVSCHAYAGPVHGGPNTAAQLEQDFQRQKHWLHANGLHAGVDHYALCPGTGSPVPEGTTMDALRRSFRSVRVNGGNYETAFPGDPLRLRSILYTGNTVAQLKTNIDACAGPGGAFIFTVHDVIAGATDGTSNGLPAQAQTNLATVLDYAASKGMVFRTRADYLDGR